MPKYKLRAYSELLFVTLIWAFASIVIKFTLNGISPLPFLVIRFAISAVLALQATKPIYKLFKINKKTSFLIILYALFSTPFALGGVFLGLNTSSVLTLSIVQALEPVILALIASYTFGDHYSKRVKIGGIIAFSGALLTLFVPSIQMSQSLIGNIFFVFYIISDIVSIIILKKLMKLRIDAWALTHLSFVVGFLTLLPFALLSPAKYEINNIFSLSPIYLLGIIYMALFSGTIAYALRAKAQKSLTVSETSFFGYLVPVFSAMLALVFLKETLSISFVLGSVAVIIGIIFAEYRKPTKIKR